MMHLESMDTVGTLCDPSHAYIKGFGRPLQPVWAILDRALPHFLCQEGHKNQDLAGKLGQLLV